eukprot:UN00554
MSIFILINSHICKHTPIIKTTKYYFSSSSSVCYIIVSIHLSFISNSIYFLIFLKKVFVSFHTSLCV